MSKYIQEILNQLDNSKSCASIDDIGKVIFKIPKGGNNKPLEYERMAFGIHESTSYDIDHEGSPYFSHVNLSGLTEEMIEYWNERADITDNPLMKARYFGLIYEFSYLVTKKNIEFPKLIRYIESLIEIIQKRLVTYDRYLYSLIKRAYVIASSKNQENLVKEIIELAIQIEPQIAEDDLCGTWGLCFDLFIAGKSKYLNDTLKQKIIDEMFDRLTRLKQLSVRETPLRGTEPYVSQQAVNFLLSYYRSIDDQSKITEVLAIFAEIVELRTNRKNAILKISDYEILHGQYIKNGRYAEASVIMEKIQRISPQQTQLLQKISTPVKIPHNVIDQLLNQLKSDNLRECLGKTLPFFIPQKQTTESNLQNKTSGSFFQQLFFSNKIYLDHNGRKVATVKSLEEDPNGNLFQQQAEDIAAPKISIELHAALNQLKEDHLKDTDSFLGYLYTLPLFAEDNKQILRLGIDAYYREDAITFIHLIIPQIEFLVRKILELNSVTVYEPNRSGGYKLVTLDRLLANAAFIEIFSNDFSYYCRTVLTEQNGWNVRNDVCHGISTDKLNLSVSDRLIHILLFLIYQFDIYIKKTA
ncbi:DUF4209 domain-containing protein [Acinetobacter sp. A2]|uniref:DUF4209 domain-containing protein n=1 Tax=Acinetobacter sp. A2 TaxID=362457 RepID=UPI003AF407B5